MRANINVRLPFERPITLFPCGCRAVVQMPAFVVEWVDPCSKVTYALGGRSLSVLGVRDHLKKQEWVLTGKDIPSDRELPKGRCCPNPNACTRCG